MSKNSKIFKKKKLHMKSDFCEFCGEPKTSFSFMCDADCWHYICVDCKKETGFPRKDHQ